jgi:lauroyl/myristoyl acyltransferase
MQKFKFQKYLREELVNLSKPDTSKQVIIDEKNPKGWKENGGVLLFIHFGNFFLSGVALKSILNINYTAIASTENFQHMSRTEANFWRKVHKAANKSYSRKMFLTNKSKSKEIVSYLQNGNFVGAAIDVAEQGRKHKFHPFKFLHNEIMLQTGPARLARIAKVPIYGMIIVYDEDQDKHQLHLTGPYSSEEIENSTQQILRFMEPFVEKNTDQLFHDLFHLFSRQNTKEFMIDAKLQKKSLSNQLPPVKRIKSQIPSNFAPRYESEITSWHPHRGFAYELIDKHKPKLIVELGVHYGDSYFTFCQACEELELHTKVFGVDHWQGDEQSGYYNDEVFEKVREYGEEFYPKDSSLLRMEFDEALEKFADDSIDLLHIDGSHYYEAVKKDFFNWMPKVKSGGIILIHDILVERVDFGVKRFWKEVQKTYHTESHLEGFGLGIVKF